RRQRNEATDYMHLMATVQQKLGSTQGIAATILIKQDYAPAEPLRLLQCFDNTEHVVLFSSRDPVYRRASRGESGFQGDRASGQNLTVGTHPSNVLRRHLSTQTDCHTRLAQLAFQITAHESELLPPWQSCGQQGLAAQFHAALDQSEL